MSDIAGRLQVLLAQEALNARKIEAELVALRAENARLREALKPFADEAIGLTDEHDDWPINYGCGDSVNFTFGHLRAARAAMGETE